MKYSVKTVEPTPPPMRVILDLSEEEADLIRMYASYYAARAPDALGIVVATAARLENKLSAHEGVAKYPYIDAFKDE